MAGLPKVRFSEMMTLVRDDGLQELDDKLYDTGMRR